MEILLNINVNSPIVLHPICVMIVNALISISMKTPKLLWPGLMGRCGQVS